MRGDLSAADGSDLACDLLAVDQAYPAPVASEAVRLRVHQAWRHGQVHLAAYDARLTLLVPGTGFTADLTSTRSGGSPRRSAPAPRRTPCTCGSAAERA